jgi:arabinofuranosyltransferase
VVGEGCVGDHAMRGDRAVPWEVKVGAAVCVLVVGVAAALTWHYVMDDAFISFRYCQNLLAGRGLVFNPGERVEGLTNVGWLAMLVLPATVAGPVVAAKILVPVLLVAALGGTAILAWRLGPQPAMDRASLLRALVILAPVALAVSQPELMLFSLLGMETAFFAAVTIGMALLLRAGRPKWVIGAGSVLLYLIHPEGAAIWPMFLLVVLLQGRGEWRRWVGATVYFLVGCAVVSAGRLAYFGDLLPNTAHVKGASAMTLAHNAYGLVIGEHIAPPFFAGLGSLAICAIGIVALLRRGGAAAAYLTAVVVVGYLFSVYAMPDWTGMARYFGSYVPAAAIALCTGWFEILGVLRGKPALRRGVVATILAVGAISLLQASRLVRVLRPDRRSTYPGYVMTSTSLKAPAVWMKTHLAPGSTIASRRIGALAYYSGLRVFDWKYGLTVKALSSLNVTLASLVSDARFGQVWREVRPDYYLEDDSVARELIARVHGDEASFMIHGLRYRVMEKFPIGATAQWWLCQRY